jgi:hypothetical protein
VAEDPTQRFERIVREHGAALARLAAAYAPEEVRRHVRADDALGLALADQVEAGAEALERGDRGERGAVIAPVLATGALLLARSFVQLLRTGPGFSPDHVLTGKLSLPEGRYGSGAAIERFADQLLPRVAALPGVRDAAIVSTLPLEDGPPVSFIIAGRPELPAQLERQVAKVDPEQPLTELRAMDEVLSRSLGSRRFTAMLLGLMSLLALALAALGVYGVVSYLVQQRTREIGIRMALGASPAAVLRLVVRQGMAAVLPGIAAGLAGTFAATRALGGMLYGIGAHDPASLIVAPALLALVALLACAIPAQRASSVDPLVALRSE